MSTLILPMTALSALPVCKALGLLIANTPLYVSGCFNPYLLWLLLVLPAGHPILLAQGSTMNQYEIEMLAMDSIVIPASAREIDESHATRLARTVPANGELLQAIGVMAEDAEVYRIIWGGHRYRAYQLLGRKAIPARVLPSETTPADEAKYTLVENAIRKNETFEEKLARVEAIAVAEGVSIEEAREYANISESEFNRCKTTLKKLKPAARRFAKEHKDKIGNSDLYLVASKAATEDCQLAALQARVDGTTRDALAHWLRVQKRPMPKVKRPKKAATHRLDAGKTKLTTPADHTCEQLATELQPLIHQLLVDPTKPISELSSV